MRLPVSVFALAVLSPLAALAQPADPNQPVVPPGGAPVMPVPTDATTTPLPPPPPPPPPPVMVVPPTNPAPPAPEPVKTWKDLLTVEGLVDGYYQLNLTGEDTLTPVAGAVPVRSFDLNTNTFTLSYTKVALSVNPEPVGLRIDIGYGATGMLVNGNSNPLLIQQAYATAAIGALTLDFGKFVTTAGAEVIEANKNWNYSRSILFFGIPLLHTGLRLTYKVIPELIVQASIVNGWNGQGFEQESTSDKTIGLSVNFTAPTGTNIIATTYFGKELAPASDDTRFLLDIVAAQTIGPLALNLNIDYLKEGDTGFFGASLMGRYAVLEMLALALRGEYVKVKDGITLGEVTVTAAVPVANRYEFRLEIRADFADTENFNGAASPSTETLLLAMPLDKHQVTATAAFLAWF